MSTARIGVVGEAFLDVHLGQDSGARSRIGGVLHACRALSALDASFVCAPILPAYLVDSVRAECDTLGGKCTILGSVLGSPNIAIYRDTLESGDQGVVMPTFGASHRCVVQADGLRDLASDVSDVLVIPGCYASAEVTRQLSEAGVRVHVDIAYDTDFGSLLRGPQLETAFVSTSSDLFLARWGASPARAWDELSPIAKVVVLKESRGGSRAYSLDGVTTAPAFVGSAQHSVGVGDSFDAAHICLRSREAHDRLRSSSAIAAAYADTWDQERFATVTCGIVDGSEALEDHAQIRLPWERRPGYGIYVAAPDFPSVDVRPLNRLVSALEYHNFLCRLPIRENGLADDGLAGNALKPICDADLRLLDECELLVAVLLYDDPGTLIEIGIAAERGLPVIVYDPYDRARNVMLRCVPRMVSSELSDVVTAVFQSIGEMNAET